MAPAVSNWIFNFLVPKFTESLCSSPLLTLPQQSKLLPAPRGKVNERLQAKAMLIKTLFANVKTEQERVAQAQEEMKKYYAKIGAKEARELAKEARELAKKAIVESIQAGFRQQAAAQQPQQTAGAAAAPGRPTSTGGARSHAAAAAPSPAQGTAPVPMNDSAVLHTLEQQLKELVVQFTDAVRVTLFLFVDVLLLWWFVSSTTTHLCRS